jgi:bacillithiol biosynthesis cysteine-adding enzyme BshC
VPSECLPFVAEFTPSAPHVSKSQGILPSSALFAAYLHDFRRVERFYSQPPFPLDWLKDEARTIRYDAGRRARVAAVLERQNRAFGSGDGAFRNLDRLRAGASALVTGQQVSLFGGPLFAILKALTAVRVAAAATNAGADCVPVFWLATQDHDLAEVNHVVLPGENGALIRIETPSQGAPDAPVGDVCFGPEIEPVVAQAAELLGGDIVDILRDGYRPGACFGGAFGRLFARIFRDLGVILLDAADPELQREAAPVYEAALRRAGELTAGLEARGRELRDGGFHEQVKVHESSTLLFAREDGARTPVRGGENGYSIGNRAVNEADLLARIRSSPQEFSGNALLRPVVQDFLLPTLAYVGGPAEVAYFAQAAIVYQALDGRVTPILPRLAVTLVEPHIKRLLERYQLNVLDAFQPAEQLRELLGEHSLPQDVRSTFEAVQSSLEGSLRSISECLDRLDKTLVDAAERAGAKMKYQLEHLQTRAANAELRRSEILARHAAQLSAALHPERTLQERVIGGVYFLARYPNLLEILLQNTSLTCRDHQVVYL